MRVLVVNAGSSTLKAQVIEEDDTAAVDVELDPWDGDENEAQHFLERALDGVAPPGAAGHRVVHGGRELTGPTLLDRAVEARIGELAELAPLHQRRALDALHGARRLLPAIPHVACFDTAFHATMPAASRTYALPATWRDRWGLERHGFHGLSHAWVARRAPEVAGVDAGARIVSCHLGAGASLCAIAGGRSVDTTMGFTPLEGLVMATRSGSVDPGLVLWLVEHAGLSPGAVRDGLEHDSGLAGLSGTSGDMREVLAARSRGDERAGLAVDVFVHRLRQGIAAMAASLGGLDLVAFTGGVGEHVSAVRASSIDGLGFLGLRLDPAANDAATGDADITGPGASARTVVVRAREHLEITHQVRALLDRNASLTPSVAAPASRGDRKRRPGG